MSERNQPQRNAANEIRKDAKAQFAKTRHGRHNSGVSSAEPRVITGDEDATFHTKPKDKNDGSER
ncbi:MAG TPA: hypothetical protein VNS34_08680 [Rhizobiaceae bacterium]|nr:hypothetical protein [Rhizobiaceae bacterium]